MIATAMLICLASRAAAAFGGFVVAKAEGEPTIESASLVLMHDDRRTVLTIAADYRGPAGEVALIVAVPQRISKQAVRVVEAGVIERLEHHTAPRMVEVWERDPCYVERPYAIYGFEDWYGTRWVPFVEERLISTNRHFVREGHAITVLRDPTGDALAVWLREHGYVVPAQLDIVLDDVEPHRHFIIVELHAGTRDPLPPLQVSYEHEGLVVPLRLGFVNPSDDARDIVIHVITPEHVRPLDRSFASMPSTVVREVTHGNFDSFYAGLLGLFGENVAIEFIEEFDRPSITLDDLDTLGLSDLRKARRWQEYGGYDDEILDVVDELVLTRMRMRVSGSVADLYLGAYEPGERSFVAETFLLHHFAGPVKCPLPRFGRHERSSPLGTSTFPERAADDLAWWTYLDEPAQLDSLLELKAPKWQTGAASDARGSAHCAVDDRASPAALLLLALAVYLACHAHSLSVSRTPVVRVPRRRDRLQGRAGRGRRDFHERDR